LAFVSIGDRTGPIVETLEPIHACAASGDGDILPFSYSKFEVNCGRHTTSILNKPFQVYDIEIQ
jgi:hypothetical protein